MPYFAPKNGTLPTPKDPWVPQELYDDAHAHFAIGYTDVALRNLATGEFFFPVRDVEPERGNRWFIGGRLLLGESPEASAARHVQHDTGLAIPAGRFFDAANFGIAHVTKRSDVESQSRHAQNTVLFANLRPAEVTALDSAVCEDSLSREYSGGGWFDPSADRSQLPDPVKYFLRGYFEHTVLLGALYEIAKAEDIVRSGGS